jgi:cytochrome c oxidase cbb3-type subunit 3
MRNKLKYIPGLMALFFLLSAQTAWAAGPPAPSLFSNTLAIVLFILMILLLIIIAVLGNILLGTADLKMKKKKKAGNSNPVLSSILLIGLLLAGPALFAQTTPAAAETTKTIGGMPSSTFYVMITVIFLELFVVIALLINIKFMLKNEQEKFAVPIPEEIKKTQLSWWDRFNKLKPVSQEAELDLGHEYDGIRELNNRLPPWWLYGFYATILFAGIYLWRFHISHDGPSSKEEYDRSVVSAEIKIKEYLKSKGESVDENTVTLLTGADDIAAGKLIFTDPAKCPACHMPDGGGNNVGPNLTDDYWIYGGTIKNIFNTIKYGTSKGMRSWKDDLSAKQIAQVASYVKSLKGSKPANPKEPQGELFKEDVITKSAADSAKAGTGNPK